MSFTKLFAFIQKDILQFKNTIIFFTVLSIIYSFLLNITIFGSEFGKMHHFYEIESVAIYMLFGAITFGFIFYFVYSHEFERKTIRSLAYYDMDYIDFCRYKIITTMIVGAIFFLIIFWFPLIPPLLFNSTNRALSDALGIYFGVIICYGILGYISIFFNNFLKYFGRLKSHNSHMIFAILFIFSFIFTETFYGIMYEATHDEGYYDDRVYDMEEDEPNMVFKFFMYLSPFHVTAKTLDSLCTNNTGYDFYLILIFTILIFIFHEFNRNKFYFDEMIER